MKTILSDIFSELPRQSGLYILTALCLPFLFMSTGVMSGDELLDVMRTASDFAGLPQTLTDDIAKHASDVLAELSLD